MNNYELNQLKQIEKNFHNQGNLKLNLWACMDLLKTYIKDLRYFISGILNLQKGINIINTRPILNDAINIGGTELFRANFATGKALP